MLETDGPTIWARIAWGFARVHQPETRKAPAVAGYRAKKIVPQNVIATKGGAGLAIIRDQGHWYLFPDSLLRCEGLADEYFHSVVDTIVVPKLYLDSVDPDLVRQNIEWGPVRRDQQSSDHQARAGRPASTTISSAIARNKSPTNEAIAWQLTDQVVQAARKPFIRPGR